VEAAAGAKEPFAEVGATPEHRLAVLGCLVGMTGDPTLAEDLTQDTFVRALRAWRRYDPRRAPVRVWLLQIARSVWLDHLRRERGRRRREIAWAAQQPESTAPATADGALPAGLRVALGRLTPGEREVVALRVLLSLDGQQAAQVLGITETSCSSTLHRAMTKLRREVASDEPAARDHA
jgi:RNA polymerase sigma-70 factor (ECF subfamily)